MKKHKIWTIRTIYNIARCNKLQYKINRIANRKKQSTHQMNKNITLSRINIEVNKIS